MRLGFISFVFSLILFWSVNVPLPLFEAISLLIVIYFVSLYNSISKNHLFWKRYLAIAFPNIAAYVAIKYFQGFEFDFSAPYAIFALYIFTLLVIFFIFILKSRKHNKANKDEDALFADREKDLECLKNYLRSYKIVGLNAKWGDGKTFLINKLRKQLANDYHFITIEVLASTIDSIETYIIDEISNLLEINGIYPSKSLKIKRFFERSNYGWLKALFEKNESYDKMMESLICDLEKLDKPLILNFEDIDRLASGDIVMKIFSLTEKLSKSEKIKVIFQYDNQKLLNVLKQDNIFIEKYIPHEVNLTKISFLNQLKLSCISKKIQDFPLNEVLECSAIPVPRDIQFLFLTDNIVNLVPKDFSIRRIESFLLEVKGAMSQDCFKNDSRIVVAYYLMKFFYDDVFSDFVAEESFLNTCKFDYYGKKVSVIQMIRDNKFDIENQEQYSQQESSYSRIAFICLLGYHLDFYKINDHRDMYEDETALKHIDKNEHIDRILWKLHCFGHSNYTDMENAVKHIKNDVLFALKQLEDKKNAFKDIVNRMLRFDFENGHNGTIFKLGNPLFANVFQAFNIYENDSETWIKLIDFYFEYANVKNIDNDLIVTFMYANLSRRKTFCHLMKRFNQLNVIGNFKKSECYKKFMEKYSNAIFTHGFSYAFRGLLEDEHELNTNFISEFIKQQIQFIESEKTKTIPSIQQDLELVLEFLQKNVEIMEATQTINTTPVYVNIGFTETKSAIDFSIFEGKSLADLKEILDDGYRKEIYSKSDVDNILGRFNKTQCK